MSDDDVLSAIAGISKGFSNVYVPYLQARYKSKLDIEERRQAILEEKKAKQVVLPPHLAGQLNLGTGPVDPTVVSAATTLAAKEVRPTEKQFFIDKKTGRQVRSPLVGAPGEKIGITTVGETPSDENRKLRMDTAVLNYSNQLENHYQLKELNKQGNFADQMNDLTDLVRSGNTVAFSALGTKTAKAMGEVGVLTESDIARYVRSGRLDTMARDTLLKWIRGSPTEATLTEIGQIADVIKDSQATKIQPIYDRYVNRLAVNFDMTPQEAAKRLDVPYSGIAKTQSKTGGESQNQVGASALPERKIIMFQEPAKQKRYEKWKAINAK